MNLLFLNKMFEPCLIIDSFNSLSWARRYYDVGSFSVEIISDIYKNIQDSEAKYLYCTDFKETAILETLDYDDRGSTTIVILTGRFLENLLENRVIKTTRTYRGTTEQIARSIVNDFCINCQYPIEKLQLGTYKGLGQNRIFQVTGEDVKTTLYELLKLDELSYSIDYDFENDELKFYVWQGLDRTEAQENNSWVTFSKNFENIQNDKYSIDETKYKNIAVVAGQGEGADRTIVEVNKVKSGEDRKELYVDARDLQQDEDMTETEYLNTLKQRGESALQENNRVETTEFEIDPDSNLQYKKDYDLGDKVTYKNEDLNLYIENRIIEIAEVFEDSEKKIDIVFGDDYNIKRMV